MRWLAPGSAPADLAARWLATFVQSKNANAFIDTLQNSIAVPIASR